MHKISAQKIRLGLRLLGVLLPLLVALVLRPVEAADLRKITSEIRQDNARIVLDLNGAVQHSLFTLTNPNRVVIDLSNTRMATSTNGLKFQGSAINNLRHAVRNGTDLRLVIDVNDQLTPRTFVENNGQRLVVDLGKSKASAARIVQSTTPSATPSKVVKSVVKDNPRRDLVIAIDAGHGGSDPGAVGPKIKNKVLYEKDIVLAIAKELKTLIEKERGYRVVMIRNGDYFVPLKERRNIARKHQADLMLSIHADAFTNTSANGASVFAISNKGATSAMAAFLAKQENNSDVIGGVKLSDKDDVLAGVLTDLSMTASQEASLKVGRTILNNLGRFAKLHSSRVEQAGFAVLKAPDIPAILIETGFISNPSEATRLADRSYQRKLATAIFQGVDSHFSDAPPPDTYLAWRKENRRATMLAKND